MGRAPPGPSIAGRVEFISPTTRHVLHPCSGARDAAIAIDGGRLFVGCENRTVVVISTATQTPIGTFSSDERIDALAPAADGTHVVIARGTDGDSDGVLSVYEVATGALTARRTLEAFPEYDTTVTLLRAHPREAHFYLSRWHTHKQRARLDRFSDTLVIDSPTLMPLATILYAFDDMAFRADGSMAVGLWVTSGFVASGVTAFAVDLTTHAASQLASTFSYGNPSVEFAEPPLAPTQLDYTEAGRTVTLSWTLPPSSKAATHWQVEVRQTANGPVSAVLPVSTPDQAFSVASVPAGNYVVRLRGGNAVGHGAWSAPLVVAVP